MDCLTRDSKTGGDLTPTHAYAQSGLDLRKLKAVRQSSQSRHGS